MGVLGAFLLASAPLACSAAELLGKVIDPQGRVVPGSSIQLSRRADSFRSAAKSDATGSFHFDGLDGGEYRLTAEAPGFPIVERTVAISGDGPFTENLQFTGVSGGSQSVTVAAETTDVGLFQPDPAQRLLIRNETLDANPGRPGMPVSIPGMPVESPAGGVKPPQYFVPGVAGDHGEPIAMFFQVGGFLFPNNLPVNAHGNGYADPNIIIPGAIEAIETDGAAFNVREGNNAVNAAIVFGLKERLEPEIRLTADYRDVNLVGAWSPKDPANQAWAGFEVSMGNGFLKRLEHRKQYKGNISKVIDFGKHHLTAYGIGYYGFAFQPGLIPINTYVPDDTYDSRQREETANGALILNDIWQMTKRQQLQLSGFYRYYTLDVRPNFGDGWIRQSEHRNVNSEDVLYVNRWSGAFALLAGANFRREAPSALDLDHADSAGVFQPVTANNILLNFTSPFVAADGKLNRIMHYNIGYRQDEVGFDNQDLYRPGFSFRRHASIHSPKGTIIFTPPDALSIFPVIALSYGQAFHINDPRIGTTAVLGGTLVSKARSYQLVILKTIAQTEFRFTLAHVTTAQQLARISNDTGLQQDEGPGLIRSFTATARRSFPHGFIQALYARANAVDRLTSLPTPEAPRLIWDVVGAYDRLPFHLVGRAEFEHVGIKPLGDGFHSVPVRELRAALVRPFERQGFEVGLNVFIASGYGGQTLETIALPGEGDPFERITGFPLRSYVTASFTYHFRRSRS